MHGGAPARSFVLQISHLSLSLSVDADKRETGAARSLNALLIFSAQRHGDNAGAEYSFMYTMGCERDSEGARKVAAYFCHRFLHETRGAISRSLLQKNLLCRQVL